MVSTVAACGGDGPTAPHSPLGTFELAAVMGVRMPATVNTDFGWTRYTSGSLVLRGDSTYNVWFYGNLPDGPDAPDSDAHIGLGHSGTFHWTRETGALELVRGSGLQSDLGKATADTVVLGLYTLGDFPGPGGSIVDFTFVRR